jgi:hypothetical protein
LYESPPHFFQMLEILNFDKGQFIIFSFIIHFFCMLSKSVFSNQGSKNSLMFSSRCFSVSNFIFKSINSVLWVIWTNSQYPFCLIYEYPVIPTPFVGKDFSLPLELCWQLCQKSTHQSCFVAHTCNPGYFGGGTRRIVNSRTAWVKLVRPCIKNSIETKCFYLWTLFCSVDIYFYPFINILLSVLL